ncbi:hypothetical protein Spla01_06568 [Streptomyces platensis]|uniref:Uncharacterized protein n=1 Tax=Streptomyces platensis TaxID=58346 RepID=A0ABX3Y107_STRPT|nr:hypothetical protein BG653_02155 [Streptomyces platensis]
MPNRKRPPETPPERPPEHAPALDTVPGAATVTAPLPAVVPHRPFHPPRPSRPHR